MGVVKERVRTKNVPETAVFNWTFESYTSNTCAENWQLYAMTPVTYTYTLPYVNYQTITDLYCDTSEDVENPCSQNKKRFKPVSNVRESYQTLGPTLNSGSGPIKDDCQTYGMSWWKVHYGIGKTPAELSAQWDSFSASAPFDDVVESDLIEALDRIVQRIEDGMPILNVYAMILELGDLKKLIPGLLNKASTGLDAGKAVSSDAAGQWLTWNWGVLPLVGDLDSLNGFMERFDAFVLKWNSYVDSNTILDFHDTIFDRSWQDAKVDATVNTTSLTLAGEQYTSVGSAQFTAKLHLYVRPRKFDEDNLFSKKLRALGLDRPLAGLWEATPFSWLVDYITNVGDVIEDFERSLGDIIVPYDFVDGGYSTKYNMFYSQEWVQDFYINRGFVRANDSLERSEYHRFPLPESVFGLRPDLNWEPSFTPTQYTNLVAVGRNFWH